MTNVLEERDKAMVCKVIVFSFEIEHLVVKILFFFQLNQSSSL